MDTIENYKENEIRVSDKVRPWDMVNGSNAVYYNILRWGKDVISQAFIN
jgi:hypothetical protein